MKKRSSMIRCQLCIAMLACSFFACSGEDTVKSGLDDAQACDSEGKCSDSSKVCVDGFCVDSSDKPGTGGTDKPGTGGTDDKPGTGGTDDKPGTGGTDDKPGTGGTDDKPGTDEPEEPSEEDLMKDENADIDGDTIPNKWDRCDVDTDEDGIPDCKDLDSDGDTIADSYEAGDIAIYGEPDMSLGGQDYAFLSKDADGNGIPDNLECIWGTNTLDTPDVLTTSCSDTDGNGEPDYIDPDNDGDDIWDIDEIHGLYTDKTPEGKVAADCNKDGELDDAGTADAPFICQGEPAFMNRDSDGDSIDDSDESWSDSDGDGIADIYSLDSDGDTIPDTEEKCAPGEDSCEVPYLSSNGKYYFQTNDGDGDTLNDGLEPDCSAWGLGHARFSDDTDGDGDKDVSEYYAAVLSGKYTAAQAVCDKTINVKSIYEFYFELPYQGETQEDKLLFSPAVSKLDVVFNVDTTGSMNSAITSVKTNIGSMISLLRGMVSDIGIALTNFDDFTGSMCNMYSYYPYCGSGSDLPFRLLGPVSTDETTITSYTKNSLFNIRSGDDGPESGAESLYQIVTGAGVTWYNSTTKQTIAKRSNVGKTWGGVDFRENTLPVVIHVTDASSHDDGGSYYSLDSKYKYTTCGSSTSTCVVNPHYTSDLIPEVKKTGVRIITLGVGGSGAEMLTQLKTWSRESNAVVPACAFKTEDNTWNCNKDSTADKCCLGETTSDPETINGKEKQCILRYTGSQSSVANYVSKGVDALVKYGTYDVSTEIVGEPIEGKSYGTECFIKKVEAYSYIAPEQEPEHSCNPVAEPYATSASKGYKDGFRNFATGTSNVSKKGAQLTFRVVAENDTCVPQTEKPQLFEAKIRVINPTTGLVFDTQTVSILVPPKKSESIL